jgi:Flp pilus assembly pilin Flp
VKSITQYLRALEGATLIEYAFIAAMVSLVVAGGVAAISPPLIETLIHVSGSF